ncbi:MAG: hypothetical protein A2487_13375 [Candidatus Raymondbacteria bacterium RifOxyC12_full_50_8]|uniref:Haem-binding uptake Tiki superfamily ChaN domain-containing protein n=1 Tax=Candidatus Raymondbacteria bacterium RIFOXYD12_FULL_49_13 TaxID=1817890 RepID=A0A1F7FGH4_UNCRA|nr:MAG: hypothetical protein A2248_08035 [Candidatus Raymondbacteria bacterium RIFOXYA2_FULL_49_16]OGJ98708.1 MAG: hypothetical protein A2453_08200 [Candidatus Raymondbacteria bacterium RIFOXYC2_FULL_50_21]OGK01518.1 MAG: hypothetical protein A2487_13375 [Candidatus Raymondbacteria bacterium RifOxyC12_full_50_8]OGK02198.1 MAG: hypothetical protein A2350_20260 [Candidatus Raymondbacteria bacterium RifOxyB12_full_50_8]OGK05795.1 MAG: hypothetical protein A2519_01765 [Candidatus Raymondbacteria ba
MTIKTTLGASATRRTRQTLIILFLAMAFFATVMHHQAKSSAKIVKKYSSATMALRTIIQTTNPRVIGFGEFHQQEDTSGIPSALKLFTDSLLPELATITSDLIIETWMPEGDCGEAEEQVVEDIQETIKRPETTVNEVEALILKAADLGVQPHILELSCENYKKLQESDTSVDYDTLLAMIPRQIEEKCAVILGSRLDSSSLAPLIAIYGGALHNDIAPDSGMGNAAFGPALKKMTKGKYVEVDVFVPEFIASDEEYRKETWFPAYQKNAGPDSVILFRPGPDRFVIILRTTGNPAVK